jgi:tetratricopeptide (TPR) repeat protein
MLLFLNDFYYICIVKRLLVILFPVLLLACGKQQEPVVEQPLPFVFDENLQQIDSLMQTDADSALQTLLSFRAQRGTPSTFNTNYQSLLLSEALYKTYNPQLNRYRNETFQETSLHEAVQYFDSLYINYPKNDDLALLSARSHYMNGVGYYENDSVVDACREYFKTLEIMENHFEEKDMVGNKAKFMSLTYGRLSELFSDQFMPEPSIYCGKQAFHYRKIKPTSRYGVSNILYRIGVQYDVSQQIDTALYYYNMALGALPDSNNLVYRDIMTNITLLLYGNGYECSHAISDLQQIIKQTDDENEKLTRYIALAYLYYCENQLDTALFYFKYVFENKTDDISKYKPAEYLRNIHLSLGDTIKTQEYDQFLANNTVSQYDKMIVVSALDKLFYDYFKHNQKNTLLPNKKILISGIALFITIIIVIFIISKKNKKIIKHANTKYENEKNKVDKLKKELYRKRSNTEMHLESFLNEPICRKINDMICDIPTSARSHHSNYPKIKLDDEMIVQLGEAVTKHFPNLKTRLLSNDVNLKKDDLLLCYLYLLGLNNSQIALLRQCDFSTITRQIKRLKKSFKGCKDLPDFIKKLVI